ncbi:MAG: PhoH family protein [Bacteroidales bacterium]|jgi:phosphate starvation-inducible PhoH-like protein|nr:PhoH family protein [Bacteroidales bacterium]
MLERIFEVDSQIIIDLFGINNANINTLIHHFPKLKIISRGTEIKVLGERDEINEFQKKLNLILVYLEKFNKLSANDVEQILLDNNNNFGNIKAVIRGKELILYGRDGKAIKARTPNQQKLVDATFKNDMIFSVGPAGTGKTYTAVALAVRALKEKEIKRIILTRPAVEAGENLGFLPGDLRDKLDPYLQPLYDALRDMIPTSKLLSYFEDGTIEIAPLAFMRGRTLDNAYVILDEAQNATTGQLKMFLTRMGNNAKFFITGDHTQIDLPRNQNSGLLRTINQLKNIKGISVVMMDKSDVVRHKLVTKIIEAFEDMEAETASQKSNKN